MENGILKLSRVDIFDCDLITKIPSYYLDERIVYVDTCSGLSVGQQVGYVDYCMICRIY